ncbi:MAG: sigma-54-dependent Fis family transcriptional regulator [Deltaproteobacteria bacterium]|nr:sigma-54-dependent Fis family transcriptional regulator [Deltaproteobacteria bacterium]
MTNKIKILLVDDNPEVLSLLSDLLEENPKYKAYGVHSIEEAKALFKKHVFQLVISDLRLKNESGFDLLKELHQESPWVPVMVMTAYGSVDTAIEAIRKGAFDYIEKPFHSEKIFLTVSRAIETYSLRTQVYQLKQNLVNQSSYHHIISQSPKMQEVFSLIERLKSSDVNVIITGPSGTGKEMVARAIHESSVRSSGPFITLNCSAIPENLLEGELFGYKKGAFTDAKADKLGLLAEANGGTFFMDEVADLPLTLQPKLLRAVQQKEFRALGSTQMQNLNLRFLAATNQDLKQRVEEKKFREDLYYRLNVVHLDLPALKDRREDIPLLTEYFLEKISARFQKAFKGIQEGALQELISYDWPGNVRELENRMERAVALAEGEWISLKDLNLSKQNGSKNPHSSSGSGGLLSLQDMEKNHILKVLEAAKNNRSLAAKILKIDRKTLYNKLAEYQIQLPQEEEGLNIALEKN